MKMKEKVYIETSIPSYITAKDNSNPVIFGHQIVSREWWINEKEKKGLPFKVFYNPYSFGKLNDI